MRKAILITTAALCFGASAAMAQDTTRRSQQDRTQQNRSKQDTASTQQSDQSRQQSQSSTQQSDQSKQQSQSPTQQRDQSRDQSGVRKSTDNSTDMNGEWTRVQDRDIPSSLRTTLSGNQYKGWERTGVYRSSRGDRYQVRLGETNPTIYYFDKEGKPEKKNNNN
jgi:hypothetical protein